MFGWREAVDTGKERGHDFKKKECHDEDERKRRIAENPDSSTTQNSAKPYRIFAISAAGPVTDAIDKAQGGAWEFVPFEYGYYQGYMNCSCNVADL